MIPECPLDGCIKTTTGDVIQIFDGKGNCIHQRFVAGYACEYTSENDEVLEVGDERLDFYQPFDMVNPQA